MKAIQHSERHIRYRKILSKQTAFFAMPRYLAGMAMIALLLGIVVYMRMSVKDMGRELRGAFGLAAEPSAAALQTLPPVRHVRVSVSTPSPTPTKMETIPTPTPDRGVEILIYHTHATEAYRQTEGYTYAASGNCRTNEQAKSVVAVGALLGDILQNVYGYGVQHDKSNYEPPKLATAYTRSVEAMQQYADDHTNLRYFIDVHRDAYGSSPSGELDYVTIDGKNCARLMFVVGTGKGATGTGFSDMPDFDANYAFADTVTKAARSIDEGLMRDIRVKSGRYNQHISDRCLLVEVGHNANTFEHAINSVPYLAKAIDTAIKKDAGTASS